MQQIGLFLIRNFHPMWSSSQAIAWSLDFLFCAHFPSFLILPSLLCLLLQSLYLISFLHSLLQWFGITLKDEFPISIAVLNGTCFFYNKIVLISDLT